MTRPRYVFVIEQGLGHTVHGMNLERVLAGEPDIDATILRVRPGTTPDVTPLPFTDNWSVQTSWATRCTLRHHLKRRPADAIFIHTQVAALFSRGLMRRFPTIVSLDATPMDFDSMAAAYGHSLQSAPLEAAKLHMTRRALAAATSVVTWSAWTAQSVINDYGVSAESVMPVYPGVDLSRFRPTDRSDRTGPVRVLFVGGDFRRKGGEDLIRAASMLPDLVELDIVTSDTYGRIPHRRSIRFHKSVGPNSDDLLSLYANADIFALPTHGDCTPLVIAEAMASGLPIVATAVGSIPDMVRHERNGLLVRPSSPAQLAAALRSLATDPSLRQRMGRASRGLAEAEHDMYANWRAILATMGRITPHRFPEISIP